MTPTSHPPGRFCWVELSTVDPTAARPFYAALLDWTFTERPTPMGIPYTIAYRGDKQVAGVFQSWQQGTSAWQVFVATGDASATARKIGEAGGELLMPPMDIGSEGRMLAARDPTGALFSAWQARAHGGIQLEGEVGALAWCELDTPAPDRASAFYAAVFGWTAERRPDNPNEYYCFRYGDGVVGGMLSLAAEWAKGIPPHWLPYFAVADVDAALGTVSDRGGTAVTAPMVAGGMRFAIVRDPQGAVLALTQPA